MSALTFTSSATERLPLALSEVLGISLSEVMEWYFQGVGSPDDMADRMVRDVDRLVLENEGEAWVVEEQRKMEDVMERDHQGEGVDDEF
jgi:hypothetical protein